MKMVEGETLEAALDRAGATRLEPDRLADFLKVFVKVCDAVSYAHSRGLIHRDLKPANIMLCDFGQVYVLDDASSPREQERGTLFGTACYMAPERLCGMHADERTDVFALGATLYQILAGVPPLTWEMARAIWMRRSLASIAPPENFASNGVIPPEISRIAMRALSYEPANRHASVIELKRDIDNFQRETPAQRSHPSAPE
jgi:serine/threonine protein kinase